MARPSHAATITGVSGTVSHDNTITITGNAFGSKTQAAPWKWDDMNGSLNAQLEPRGWMVVNQGTHVHLSNEQLRGTPNETTTAKQLSHPTDVTGFYFGTDPNGYLEPTPASLPNARPLPPVLWIDYWMYVRVPTGATTSNYKFFRHHNQVGTTNGYWSIPGGQSGGDSNHGGPAGSGPQFNDAALGHSLLEGQWSHIQILFAPSTSANGLFYLWRNGTLHMHSTNWAGNAVAPQINFMFETQMLESNGTGVVYFDDVYIDNTPARVEIGNAPTYAASTHREIQIPSSWSNTSVQVRVNRGTFAAGTQAYLYVTDSNNVTNATGFPITFGSGTPPTPMITSISGVPSQGNTLSLTGSGFGTKSNPTQTVPAAPLLWDVTSAQYLGGQNQNAYSAISDGNTINTSIWQLINFAGNGDTARYSTSRSHRHPFLSAHYYGAGTKLVLGAPMYPGGATAGPASQRKFYLSFYRRLRNGAQTSGGGDGSVKLIRVSPWPSVSAGYSFMASESIQTNVTGWADVGTETTWVRWEIYVDEARQWFDVYKNGHYYQTSNSNAPGNVELRPAADWRFNAPARSGWELNQSYPPNEPIEPWVFGYDDGHDLSAGQEIDLSEIYYDNTMARVEISNQPTWNDSPTATATREVQGRLLTWSPTSITFNFNQGAFANGQQVYVYVIDSNGVVNPDGFPLTIGGTGPPPSACDVNQSGGAPDVADVQQCVNQAIAVAACGRGDINVDGQCNVVDVQRVVNAALGGMCVTQ